LLSQQVTPAPLGEVGENDWLPFLTRARQLLTVKRCQEVIDQIQSLEGKNIRSFRCKVRGNKSPKERGMVTDANESLYVCLALNALHSLQKEPLEFYINLSQASTVSEEGTVHID